MADQGLESVECLLSDLPAGLLIRRPRHHTMERLLADLRVSLRSLGRSPGFVASTSAILAIGIGMAAAMYTVYHVVLVERLPIAQQDRLVVMHPLDKRGTHLDVPFPYLAEIARDTLLFRAAGGPHHLGAQYLPFMHGGTTLNLA